MWSRVRAPRGAFGIAICKMTDFCIHGGVVRVRHTAAGWGFRSNAQRAQQCWCLCLCLSLVLEPPECAQTQQPPRGALVPFPSPAGPPAHLTSTHTAPLRPPADAKYSRLFSASATMVFPPGFQLAGHTSPCSAWNWMACGQRRGRRALCGAVWCCAALCLWHATGWLACTGHWAQGSCGCDELTAGHGPCTAAH